MDFAAAMVNTAGKETLLKVRGEDGATRLVLIIPISWGEWDRLRYQEIVRHRRNQVEELSGGRLGYLHIRGMSEPSVRDFERDLYAAGKDKEGLIIDVRDNGGGSTADILLSSLTAPRHAKTQPRGVDPADVPDDAYPRDRRLIYAWTRPINVLINQNSFSNAEIFAHAVKNIGRGRLIGTATFGGVISTGGTSLIDGTTVRLPFRGWYLPDGTDQENNGAKPDVDVPQMPQDEAAGRDLQLEAAVRDLLQNLK
jgi:tricorn protease